MYFRVRKVTNSNLRPNAFNVPRNFGKILGRFHKSWAHGKKLKAHPNLVENAISWAYGADV
jgi:hypothetical protein